MVFSPSNITKYTKPLSRKSTTKNTKNTTKNTTKKIM